jgi:hypothetical protein
MKTSSRFAVIVIALSIATGTRLASAQANRPANQAQPDRVISQQELQQEVHQLMVDLDDPNYDYTKVPPRIRQAFQDFRSVTNGMDPNQVAQFRADMFSQIMPVMQRNQAKIQKAMQMAFLKDLQEPLGASDEEFAVIEPLLEKVVDAQRESDGGMARFRRFAGAMGQQNASQNGRQNSPPPSPVDQASTDLQAAVDDPNSNEDKIKTRLDALRQAKTKASQDLDVARNALRSVLTTRQEAVLVDRGLLD